MNDTRSYFLISWDEVILPTIDDGLGILNLDSFYISVIVKWIYHYVNELYSLWWVISEALSCKPLLGLFPCIIEPEVKLFLKKDYVKSSHLSLSSTTSVFFGFWWALENI